MTELAHAHVLDMYRRMVRIRAFEERVRRLASGGETAGLVHLCSGQEATIVGTIAALARTDWIASNHRGHGHCLAKGADSTRLMAEILGRRTGYGLGRSGSMHVFDRENANLGTNGIVGGGVPLAVGAALSARRRGTCEVAACYFGDGALNQGIVAECMNMAAIWSLPVVFVCENNGYGEFTASEDVTAGTLASRGETYGIATETVDGMDVEAVFAAMQAAVARARGGEGPSFLICNTYRYGGHHAHDEQDYKSAEEAEAWRRRDPILRTRGHLAHLGFADETLARTDAEVEDEIAQAVRQARRAPQPDRDDLERFLYA